MVHDRYRTCMTFSPKPMLVQNFGGKRGAFMAEIGENLFRSLGVDIRNLGTISDPNFYKLYLDGSHKKKNYHSMQIFSLFIGRKPST